MRTVKKRLSQIKPYWKNPRKNESATAAVKASIEEYGYRVPILVDADNVIISGHTRYKALLELGWKEVPVIVVTDMPADKVKEFRVVDNKTAEFATWDNDALADEIKAFSDLKRVEPFFKTDEITKILAKAGGVDVRAVSQTDVDKVNVKEHERFKRSVEARGVRMFEVTCPGCAETFFVDLDELDRRLSIASEMTEEAEEADKTES